MAVCTANFELGTNGATVASTDAGDATAWDGRTLAAGATLIYDNTRAAVGSQSMKVATGGTAGSAYMQWLSAFGTNTDHYGRVYLYLTAIPSTNTAFCQCADSVGTAAAIAVQGTAGKLILTDSTGTVRATSTTTLPTNQWIRVEYRIVHSTTVGWIEAKIFTTPGSSTPVETVTTTAAWNTRASSDRVRFGYTGSAANIGPHWLDGCLAGASAYPGPLTGAGRMLLLGVGA